MDGSQLREARDESDDTGALAFSDEDEPRIVFQHKIFAVSDDGHFRKSGTVEEPVYVMSFDGREMALPFPGLVIEFGIDPDSEDFRNLGLVEESLRYVQVIRPGDPIPKEVLTGEASWEISDAHRQIAHGRLSMQMVAWLSKDEDVPLNARELLMVLEDPETRRRINEAMDEAANELGYGTGGRERVVGDIEKMGNELAYIELLREKYQAVRETTAKVELLKEKYVNEQSVMDNIVPVREMLGTAIDLFSEKFGEIDEIERDVIDSLKNIVTQVRIIQEVRNDLYCRLSVWDELLERWDVTEARRSSVVEELLRDTYRFLAPRFIKADDWVLITKVLDERGASGKQMEWSLGD